MEALILLLVILAFGYFFISTLQLFCICWSLFFSILDVGFIFGHYLFWGIILIPHFRIKYITSKLVNFINKMVY